MDADAAEDPPAMQGMLATLHEQLQDDESCLTSERLLMASIMQLNS